MRQSLYHTAIVCLVLLGFTFQGWGFLLLAAGHSMVQNVLEDVFTLAGREIVEEILRCHLNEPGRGGERLGKYALK